ncbi:hypothetical protein D3C72_1927310 [compost metagenome]
MARSASTRLPIPTSIESWILPVKVSDRSSDLDLVPRAPSSAVKPFSAVSTRAAVAPARPTAPPAVETAVAAAPAAFSVKMSAVAVPVLTAMASVVVAANRLTPSKVAPPRALVISLPRALKSAR